MAASHHRRQRVHTVCRSMPGCLGGLGLCGVAVLWMGLLGCSHTPPNEPYLFAFTPSDLLHEIGDRFLDTRPADVDLLDVPSAGVFGFLDQNPVLVSVDGRAVWVTGNPSRVVADPWIQIIDGKVRLSGQIQDLTQAATGSNPTP